MLHVYVTSVWGKKEMKSYQRFIFARIFKKFKRGVPKLSHAIHDEIDSWCFLAAISKHLQQMKFDQEVGESPFDER